MGETVDALGYKADVPSRAKDSISEKVDALRSKVSGAGSQISDGTPGVDEWKQGAKQAVGVAQENPLGLALGAGAVGFLAGMLVPKTAIEDQHIGQIADQVKEQAKQTGHDAVEHGRQIAQETAETAAQKAREAGVEVMETAQESAHSHAHDLSESARGSVGEIRDAAQEGSSG